MGVAVVTGAARGIGAATAKMLAAAGHDLVLVDRGSVDPRLDYPLATADELATLADSLGATAIYGDVADVATCAEAVAAAVDRFGGLDIAVAGAGVIAGTVAAWEVDDDGWDAVFSTNVTGTRQLARAAIPAMLDRPAPRAGRFVAIASAAAMKATPLLAAYAASKAAVASFVRSMAADLADSGITANAVLPGSTATALLDRSAAIYDLDHAGEFAEHQLQQRVLRADEVAAVIAWLCSGAASAVTGAAIPADGGMTAR